MCLGDIKTIMRDYQKTTSVSAGRGCYFGSVPARSLLNNCVLNFVYLSKGESAR
jgi:hypothetical protein